MLDHSGDVHQPHLLTDIQMFPRWFPTRMIRFVYDCIEI